MSGEGSPHHAAPVDASGLSLAIVATRWHREITDSLVARGTAACLHRNAARSCRNLKAPHRRRDADLVSGSARGVRG